MGSRIQRTAVTVVAALALATSAVACGGSGTAVGEVTEVYSKSVFVGPTQAKEGDRLSAKNWLTTDRSGGVEFKLDSGTGCRTKRNSKLKIEPGRDIRIEFVTGRSTCWKDDRGSGDKYIAGDVLITADDPVFAVRMGEGETVVQVTFGFVEVKTKASPQPVIVGPDQQAVVSAVGPTPRVERSVLSSQERRIAESLEQRLPKPDTTPPSGLDDVAAGHVLVFAIDRSMPASVQSFVREFADLVGAAWAVDSQIELLPKQEARRRLDEGAVDIVVARSKAGSGSTSVPLFTARGMTWVIEISPNTAFEESLRDFITASLQTGEYGALYIKTFGSQPTYKHSEGRFGIDLTQPALTPPAVEFGQIDVGAHRTRSLTLTAGSKGLTISRVPTDLNEFGLAHDCPDTLAVGSSCRIDVTFAPTTAGPSSATVTVTVAGGPPLAATLSGTGVQSTSAKLAPAVADFGQVDVGTSKGKSLTLTAGSEDLRITQVATDLSEFIVTPGCPETLAAGKSCKIEVVFRPASVGPKSAKLRIDLENDQSPEAQLRGLGVRSPTIEPSRMNFGEVVVGDLRRKTIRLSAGSEPLTIIMIRTRHRKEFAPSSRCPAQLAPGASCLITVQFKPLKAVRQNSVLTISFSKRAPLRVRLTGTGIEAFVELDPASLDFGPVSYSPPASSVKTVALTNSSSAPLTLTISSSDDQFSVEDNCPSPVAIGESCEFAVTFAPSTDGVQSATVIITGDGSRQDTLPVTGVGVLG